MKEDKMEIEDRLREAAHWQPQAEMPQGLERRALAAHRPPLRPIGLARPTAFASMALAGAACAFFFHLSGGKVETPVPSPHAAKPAVDTPLPPTRPAVKPPVLASRSPEPTVRRRPTRTRPPRKPKRYTVEASDPIVVESRIAVDAPVYAPAYYAQPSEDGQSIEYTPVVASLGDPDVIYTP